MAESYYFCHFWYTGRRKSARFPRNFYSYRQKKRKSLFASALIAYMAFLEPEYGQEIYCLAPKLDQAALVYDGFHKMVKAEPELLELARKRAVIFTLRAGNSASGYNSIGKYLYENHPIMVKPMNSMEIRTLRLINFFIIIEYAFPFLTFLFCQTGNRHMV